MDIVRAFTYIFDDKAWLRKVVITAIVSMIPIVNLAALGWVIQLITNVIRGDTKDPMPEWDQFGQKFEDGVGFFIAAIVYNGIVFAIICVLASITGILGNTNLTAITALFALVLAIAALAAGIVINAGLYIGVIEFTFERSMGVYWQIGYNFRTAWANIGILIKLVVFTLLAGLGLALVGWIPCIGQIIVLTLSEPVTGHLAGQAGIQIVQKRRPVHKIR